MDWNLIHSFLAVAETGTLIKAAEQLRVSQPTLGRHITELEQKMGFALFIRDRSGMTLTDAGISLIDDAKKMAAEAEKFALKAAGQQTVLTGSVRIAASEVVATYILPKILTAFREEEPKIDIELVASNKIENLLSRDADIAVRMIKPTQSDLIARKVNDMQLGAFATKNYLERYGKPKTPENLFTHQLVGYDRSDLMVKQLASFGYAHDRNMFAFRTDNQVANWELVKAGAGIGFGGLYIADQSPDLVRLVPDLEFPTLPVWLASHQELKTNPRIRRAMDFLYESLKKLPLSEHAKA
ncbi:LysR family transcriptional regulator [Alphaproteobacteria bacterium 46_93_T64]|nr:LysR family transcriptional regulator [Alphaproteobacteria bacterium 46_93_T64]